VIVLEHKVKRITKLAIITTSICVKIFDKELKFLIIFIIATEYCLYKINIKINLSSNDIFLRNIYKSNT